MALQVSVQGTSSEGGGGNGFSKPCNCHFVVENIEDHSGDAGFPRVEVTVVSVASNVPDQVGKKRTEKFPLTPPPGSDKSPLPKLLQFCCAVGLYTKPQWDADVANRVDPIINVEDAIGRTFTAPVSMKAYYEAGTKKKIEKCKAAGDHVSLAKLEEELAKNAGKSFPSLGGDWNDIFHALGDPESDSIPLDPDYLASFQNGMLPTKLGTFRQRGSKPQPAGPAKPAPVSPAPAGGSAAPAATGGFFG